MPDLIPGYRYEVMARADLQPPVDPLTPPVFAETGHLGSLYALSPAEQGTLEGLGERLRDRHRPNYGVF